MTANTFLVHQPKQYPPPGYRSWNPHDDRDVPDPLCVFWGRVLRRVDDAFPNRGLKFIFSWDNDAVPVLGDDVIVIQLTDDRGRLPTYSADVGLVFKQFGTKYPFPLPRPEPTLFFLNSVFTRMAVTLLRRLPYALRVYKRLLAGHHPHVVSLPGGYYHSSDDRPKSIAERRYDVAFLGSLENNSKYFSRFLPSIKTQVRANMLKALERTAAALPDAVIKTRLPKTYNDAIVTEPAEYTRTLFDSKICLAPQGMASESYRFHEAIRAGAVVISGKMPKYRYFENAPTVTLSSWKELPVIVSRLLRDPRKMQAIQEASVSWWEDHCSEAAVAAIIVDSIERITRRRCSCLSVRTPARELVEAANRLADCTASGRLP